MPCSLAMRNSGDLDAVIRLRRNYEGATMKFRLQFNIAFLRLTHLRLHSATPSFTWAQSMRSVPLSLNTSP
jgi:hypothetical protein